MIELKGLSKTYYIGGNLPVYALKNISFKIEPGEFVAIMGSSGSGKSTLLAILGLLDKPDPGGEYYLLDKDISKMSDNVYARLRNHFFGFVFQMFNLLPRLSVVANTMLPFIYSSDVTPEKRNEALLILKKIGLGDRLNHRSNELSGGQQQRVALARALANQPLVILADEPTGNLDSKSSQEIIGLLKKLNEQGHTIVMVTHEHDIAQQASRIVSLSDGKIVSDENIRKEIKRKAPEFPPLKRRGGLFCSLAGLKNYAYEAFLSIINNKLRSILSILGVMIGVAAVITMLALGSGAKRNMEETLSSLGTNLLMVRAPRRLHGISLGSEAPTRFTFVDLKALERIDGVERVVPYVSGRAQAVYKNRNWNTNVVGTSVGYPYLRDLHPEIGRFFTPSEALSRAKLAVIGQTVAKELFGDEDPVGRPIRINRVNFKVIGVLPEQGASGWRNMDDQIIIPIKTAMYRLLGNDYIAYFEVQVKDMDSVSFVENEIVDSLLALHHIPESERQRIDIINMAEIQEAANALISTLAYLLGAIAAVSLLVGGIGIMNIMLVMVMERTHEIGLRKALGAQRRDIMIQFLVEAVLICVFGGVIGIIFGAIISSILSAVANWTVYISLGSVLLAFVFSVLVGIIFGLWPAFRASKLLPIVALRYE
ncbi:MAG: ABC transporter permease [Candidatus Saganbacteria bacterium]|nr:ABC transporter permease [Candidatus Saganbacteria bacterium]